MSLRTPKRMRADASHSHRHAPKMERSLAKRVGGKLTPGSGSGGMQRGDVRKKKVVRIEAKCTIHKSFSITREMVEKIEMAAMCADELPVIVVQFLEGTRVHSEVCVVPKWVLDKVAEDGSS